jgi:hypothetical protein
MYVMIQGDEASAVRVLEGVVDRLGKLQATKLTTELQVLPYK